MPVTDGSFGALEGFIAFAVVAICAFSVTFVATDLLGVRRGVYVAVLTVVSAALLAGYAAVAGLASIDAGASHWRSGIIAGVIAAAAITPLVHRLPRRTRTRDGALLRDLTWEGVVYGIDEAILLAILPVITVWNAIHALGGGTTVAVILSVLASVVVVIVHHLGYREFRGRAARTKLVGAVVACGAQALAFALTGSILAPVIAHVVLHAQLIVRGVELPPADRRAPVTRIGASGPPPTSSAVVHRSAVG